MFDCADVEVAKTATVAELKQAVEAAFSHLPSKGPGKISWSHVGGDFAYAMMVGSYLQIVNLSAIMGSTMEIRSDDSSDDDQENSQQQYEQHYDDRDENIKRRCELKLAQLLGGFFSYRRLGSSNSGRRSKSNNILSSKFAGGFLRSFRSIVRLCRSSKQYSPRDPLEEV
ncbi:hypothetical protein LOK49_LG11G01492 [Camellia lanceoleosa]|uniref:Uncharacterized protein n=1 Tax=Camellia lanceoleosa TaxID=1840588 RepID=A0ACC0G3H4_9ERIC|nr:hypothetical protein LOK49_LG11G01492 [Camellia lanceoleosa]